MKILQESLDTTLPVALMWTLGMTIFVIVIVLMMFPEYAEGLQRAIEQAQVATEAA